MKKIKTFWQYIVPQLGITRLFGYFASRPNNRWIYKAIQWYIRHYGVNMEEAIEQDLTQYRSFNDFFIRRLKPELRPIAHSPIVSPTDGKVSQIGRIAHNRIIQAKGYEYTVNELLGDSVCGEQFIQGYFATIYLSPKDYHRVHMPCDAKLKTMRYIPGHLFSVNTATAETIPRLFARNERLVVSFDTNYGPMAMILVGAINVASIGTAWFGDIQRQKEIRQWNYPNPKSPQLNLKKGEEMGYFKLGSTVILLFSDHEQFEWLQTIQAGSDILMGQSMVSGC